MVTRYRPAKSSGVARYVPQKPEDDWQRAKEVRVRANKEKHICDRIAYRMAAAYVAGDYDGNYLHWTAQEDRHPAVSAKACDRMIFVIDEVRKDKVLCGALVHYLMSDK